MTDNDSTGASRTRAEHLQWCKDRALETIDRGDITNAIAGMGSDLSKHPETTKHPGIELMMMMALAGQLQTPEAVRRFIKGFN